MDSQTITPESVEERIVWFSIRGTYGFYLMGALYVVAPVLGWLLLLLLIKRIYLGDVKSNGQPYTISLTIWVWIAGMVAMLISLLIAHVDFSLGIGQTIKSTIGWAKGWALLAIFPLLGMLQIRPELVYRAVMHLCLHTLLLLPLFVFAWILGLPQTPYISPLQVIGGPGPEFFALSLYEIDPGSGLPRWRLFTPWAPALGFVANICFLFALQEKTASWRWIGITASIIMVLISGSRLALVALASVWIFSGTIRLIAHRWAPLAIGWLIGFTSLIALPILNTVDQAWQAFRSARIDSSRVRETLAKIALERWQADAYWWGHGIVQRGHHGVEFMPIGSHHSWYGLLFVKGIVGAFALAIPMAVSFVVLAYWSIRLPVARVGLAVLITLFLYTFGENLEILAYLIWPGLLLIGIAFREIDTHRAITSEPLDINTGELHHA